jgi:outer membrane protein assembly factor BamD
MLMSYERLGLDELRSDTERVMKTNFPRSELLSKGYQSDDRRWWQVWK